MNINNIYNITYHKLAIVSISTGILYQLYIIRNTHEIHEYV